MESLPTPHNNFFQFAISHLPNARSLIETQLPQQALVDLNLDTLRLEQGSFIDPELRERYSDLLFSVELAEKDHVSAKSALVYFLFEHKSQFDPLTVFQLLSYIVRIQEKRLRDGLPLCPVIPLVVYHGESPWSAATSMAELLQEPKSLADYQVQFRFSLLDLSVLADDEIRGEPILRSTLQLLKYSRSIVLVEKLREIIQTFWLATISETLGSDQLNNWLKAIGSYVMAVNKNIDDQQYLQTLESVFPTKFEPGSLADRLLIRGRQEGRQEGLEEGRQEGRQLAISMIQLLQRLLGEDSLQPDQLQSLSLESIKKRIDDLQQRLDTEQNSK